MATKESETQTEAGEGGSAGARPDDGVDEKTASAAASGNSRRSAGAEKGSGDEAGERKETGEIMPEITPEALYRAIIDMYDQQLLMALRPKTSCLENPLFKTEEIQDYRVFKEEIELLKQKTRILDDGSVLFAGKKGTARVVIHKILSSNWRSHPDLKRLWFEWSTKQVASDVVIVVYCIESHRQYVNLSELHGDTKSYLSEFIRATGYKALAEGFAPCVLTKYIPATYKTPPRWCVSPVEDKQSRSLVVHSSDDGLSVVARMICVAIPNMLVAKAASAVLPKFDQKEFKSVGAALAGVFVASCMPQNPLWGPP